jgi:hypothetical protein
LRRRHFDTQADPTDGEINDDVARYRRPDSEAWDHPKSRGAALHRVELHGERYGCRASKLQEAEPGVLLTLPPNASRAAGYLLVSEIALLKLDVDLVILSACNTAASGEGKSDETLSGLTLLQRRSAGACVSRWAVGHNPADHHSVR